MVQGQSHSKQNMEETTAQDHQLRHKVATPMGVQVIKQNLVLIYLGRHSTNLLIEVEQVNSAKFLVKYFQHEVWQMINLPQ